MHALAINWLPLIVAVIVRMAAGALWYSPILFLPRWLALAGRNEAEVKAGMPKALTGDLVGAIVMALVLIHAIHYMGAQSVVEGAEVGFFAWLGFVAVTTLSVTLHEARPFGLFTLNNGFQLVSIILMGGVIAWLQ